MNENTAPMDQNTRNKIIVRTSLVGVGANVLLAAMKAIVGLVTGSIAVVLDAVNNLSDALSSVITILGAKLSAKKPDKKHPLGYGRIEYLSAMIVSALVLYAGITSLVESIKKIIHPEKAEYTIVSLVLIAAAVAAKLILGSYVKARGKRADSASLVASGEDARFDAILSASVLVCAILYLTTGLALEAWVGVVISGFIIKSGIEMMLDTVNDILGSRMDPDLSKQVKGLICQEEGVSGAYDLLMTDYGPGRNYASVHMEVTDTATAEEIDRMTRRIQTRVHEETGLIITGIGIYSRNTHNAETAAIQKAVTEAVMAQKGTMGVHGFYVDTEARDMRFDTVFSFAVDPREALEKVRAAAEALYPEYSITITADVDLSD